MHITKKDASNMAVPRSTDEDAEVNDSLVLYIACGLIAFLMLIFIFWALTFAFPPGYRWKDVLRFRKSPKHRWPADRSYVLGTGEEAMCLRDWVATSSPNIMGRRSALTGDLPLFSLTAPPVDPRKPTLQPESPLRPLDPRAFTISSAQKTPRDIFFTSTRLHVKPHNTLRNTTAPKLMTKQSTLTISSPQISPRTQARLTYKYRLSASGNKRTASIVRRTRSRASSVMSRFRPLTSMTERHAAEDFDADAKRWHENEEKDVVSPMSPISPLVKKGRGLGKRFSEMTVFGVHPGKRMSGV